MPGRHLRGLMGNDAAKEDRMAVTSAGWRRSLRVIFETLWNTDGFCDPLADSASTMLELQCQLGEAKNDLSSK